ncbi:MAG: ACT domain-containing protein, partial [Thermodesulfobacteriota bacterium]|nr:ACT domain-containing protein [Thermodesulfobacteriota bacterium]
IDNVMVRFAKCCSPLPGDDIVGCVTRGRGVSVHVANCPMIQNMEPERIIDVYWNISEKQTYPVNIRASCKDKKGLLTELSNVISSLGINISYVNIETMPGDLAICDFQLEVSDLKQFNMILTGLKKLKSVHSVERIKGPVPHDDKRGSHERIV